MFALRCLKIGVLKQGFSGCWKVLGCFVPFLCCWGFLISILIAPMGDSEGKCYQQSCFPLLCLCGFVLFPCSRHSQPSVPVSALKISRGTGLLLQSQGHKKVNYILIFFMVMKLRKTSKRDILWKLPFLPCFVIGESHLFLADPQTAVLR